MAGTALPHTPAACNLGPGPLARAGAEHADVHTRNNSGEKLSLHTKQYCGDLQASVGS
jgi:uncharacterized protein (DUF849 family)